ncbi:aldo/keto reductase [Acidipropionibacterium timonense]|uniref:aldo/keto reductase n=1 Tax=Acidipropionibacterium timonense TaxID=2161818 RepID=UPI0010308F4B|nr:aldo/keto reductase [Acidipropionibacterium timonense]
MSQAKGNDANNARACDPTAWIVAEGHQHQLAAPVTAGGDITAETLTTPSRPGGEAVLAGRRIARVGFGTMQLPRLGDVNAGRAVLRRARELGVNHFDTAQFYGNGAANACLAAEVVGDPEVVIVTKVGARPASGPVPLQAAQRPEELREDVHENLRTLGVEQLDVVNLRRIPEGTVPPGPGQVVPFEDQLAEMVAMRQEGLIGAIGLSTVDADQLRGALPAGIVCVQNAYSLVSLDDEPLLGICRDEGIAWAPYFPLGGGFPGSAKVVELPAVLAIAEQTGATPAQIGLFWLLHHAPNTLVIAGTASIDHLEQNVAAGSLELSEWQLTLFDAAVA